MPRWRSRVLYFVLIPAICAAAGILGYYTWLSASRFAQLGEQTISQNTLLLVREKVETIEQYIIEQDNAAMRLARFDVPESIEETWRPNAAEVSPSIRALLVVDDAGEVRGLAVRDNAEGHREFRKVFVERIMPDLELQRLQPRRLRHLHRRYAGNNYLLSYKAYRYRGRRWYVVAHHDTGYIIREEFPRLFATEEGKRQYNVVDSDNRRVYGRSLANAGDYLVGHRFPTTLYNWRLQVAPKQAPLLDAQGRSRRITEIALLGIALLVIVLAVFFLMWAAYKERKLNELKGDFIANVSHELKTPLSVVRMFSELLATNRVKSDEKREQYLAIIVRESERLSALIENVLDFSALERGRQKYELREGNLLDVVHSALETFVHRVEQEGTEIELHVAGDVPAVLLDEQAILLAIINLLDNAVKYGERSPITVTVEVVRDFVQLRVRDRGPGIAEDARKRIFERFYRSRRDAHIRGSGIGLSLVKHIAAAHGGRAWASNAKDGGAVVGFALPIALSEAPDQQDVAVAQRTSL